MRRFVVFVFIITLGLVVNSLAQECGPGCPICSGSGSVQTGKSDQSVFFQLTKAFDFSEEFSARFSIGAASLLPAMNKGYFLVNLTMTVKECWSPFLSFDGLNFHLGLSWIPND